MTTLYEILSVDQRADVEIISHVYRLLAKRYHPDRSQVTDSQRRMAQLNDAYSVLSDPTRRARYDASIGISNGRSTPVVIKVEPACKSTNDTAQSEPTSIFGEAGPPPPYPAAAGSILTFGRYQGWAVSQVEAHDRNYLEWLRRTPIGRAYSKEVESVLRRSVTA